MLSLILASLLNLILASFCASVALSVSCIDVSSWCRKISGFHAYYWEHFQLHLHVYITGILSFKPSCFRGTRVCYCFRNRIVSKLNRSRDPAISNLLWKFYMLVVTVKWIEGLMMRQNECSLLFVWKSFLYIDQFYNINWPPMYLFKTLSSTVRDREYYMPARWHKFYLWVFNWYLTQSEMM